MISFHYIYYNVYFIYFFSITLYNIIISLCIVIDVTKWDNELNVDFEYAIEAPQLKFTIRYLLNSSTKLYYLYTYIYILIFTINFNVLSILKIKVIYIYIYIYI